MAGGIWGDLRLVADTASTNADVAAALRAVPDGGEPPAGVVVVTEHQSAGRGRLGRTWSAPARSSVLLSAGLLPQPPPDTWSVLPLLAGVAAVEAVQAVAGVPAGLKWPNDLLVAGRKLGGILVERVERPPGRPGAVIGIGVNVSLRSDELPTAEATSVALEGGTTDREPLVAEILRALGRRVTNWTEAGGDARTVLPAYRAVCVTMSSDVTVQLPGGGTVTGRAVDVDDTGRLVVADAGTGERRAWSAGDVTHLRPR